MYLATDQMLFWTLGKWLLHAPSRTPNETSPLLSFSTSTPKETTSSLSFYNSTVMEQDMNSIMSADSHKFSQWLVGAELGLTESDGSGSSIGDLKQDASPSARQLVLVCTKK